LLCNLNFYFVLKKMHASLDSKQKLLDFSRSLLVAGTGLEPVTPLLVPPPFREK